MSVYSIGCCIGQGASPVQLPPGLPNSLRSDSAIVLTGFHSATVRSTPGSVSTGTNVLAMNVIGKIDREADALHGLGRRQEAAEQDAEPDDREREGDHQRVAGDRLLDRACGSASRRPARRATSGGSG